MVPVVGPNVKPAGRDGLTAYALTVPVTVGVSDEIATFMVAEMDGWA
jgi:hypothetical protein